MSQPSDDPLRRQQELYDRTWHEGLARGIEHRSNLTINLAFLQTADVLRPGDRVLEIGCGIGTVCHELAQTGYDVIGTDISRQAIEYGQAKYTGLRLEAQPAEALPYPDGSFDAVLSFDLFEHIARIDLHVTEVLRLLKPGGHYLFQTPNKLSNVVFETLSSRSLRWKEYHPSLHSPRQLRRRLMRHGFEVRFIKMDPRNEFTMRKLRKTVGPLHHLVRIVPFTKLPMAVQTNLYIVARKMEPPDRAGTEPARRAANP